jgi:large conductance mechanosensitive channel
MLKEFKEFALKGNVMDLAVGVIIGGAFGKIVDSLVADLVMPLVAAIFGKVDFSNLYLVLSGAAPAGASLADARKAAVVMGYGNFITVAINFIILAFAIFLMVKAMNAAKKPEPASAPAAAPEPTNEEKLLGEIRDLLRK